MKINIAIIRGGIGREYDISLQSGARVLSAINRKKYQPIDVLVDKEGVWHADGAPLDPSDLKYITDVVFNLLHGPYGEDGLMSQFLEDEGIPYIGSSPLGSRMAYNKAISKEKFKNLGIKTPASESIRLTQKIKQAPKEDLRDFMINGAKKVFEHVSPPWVIKPACCSFSIDVYYAENFDQMLEGIAKVLYNHETVLVEQYIKGREIAVGLAENFRDEEYHIFHPVDVIKKGKVLDREERERGHSYAKSPLTQKELEIIRDAVARIHKGFELKDYSLVDFILSKNGLYVLEVDNLPGFSDHSMFPKSLEIAGVDFPDFIDHLIQNTLNLKK